ncbi:hypothetical protein [Salinisphaera sp. S4-8]|uniref:hypothetical protein n=1 Tax=Salinisphaera sp. S4-8 TaxID=633357 RepID=UPI0033426EA8
MNARARVATLLVVQALTGCAGIVGGELARVDQTGVSVPVCKADDDPRPYYFALDTAVRNGSSEDNLAASVSGWTFGLVPTYWLTPVTAEARFYHQGDEIARYEYAARIHKFYGLLWVLPLIPINAAVADYNEVPANEGLGLMTGSIIKQKAAARAFLDATQERGLSPDQVCYQPGDRRD